MLIETGVVSEELAEKCGLGVEGWNSLITGFYEGDYLSFNISGDVLTITGASKDPERAFLLVHVKNKDSGGRKAEKVGRMDAGGRYDISLSLGRLAEGEYYLDVYGNDERYNYYTSIVLSSLILKKTENGIYFEASPVYGRNLRIQNGSRPAESDNIMTPSTRSSQEFVDEITALAEKITGGLGDDYEKVLAIHNWVSEEIYYVRVYLGDIRPSRQYLFVGSGQTVCGLQRVFQPDGRSAYSGGDPQQAGHRICPWHYGRRQLGRCGPAKRGAESCLE
jgi:hypothetical protein